jgi:hypothetical protein
VLDSVLGSEAGRTAVAEMHMGSGVNLDLVGERNPVADQENQACLVLYRAPQILR